MAALNLGSAGAAPAVEIPMDEIAWWGWIVGLAPIVISLLLTRIMPRKTSPPASWLGLNLTGLPSSAKLLIMFFLTATALTHLFAAGAVWQTTQVTFHGNAEYFRFAKPLHLFRMSHQHAFGHGTMYLLVGAIFLCTHATEWLKVLGVSLTSLGRWPISPRGGCRNMPVRPLNRSRFSAGYLSPPVSS